MAYRPSSSSTRSRTITMALLVVLAGWFLLNRCDRNASVSLESPQTVMARGDLASDEKATVELFERSRDSVVFITTSQKVTNLWNRNVQNVQRGTGSGFVWDSQGHIVTNFHVIAGASEARVRLSDGKEYHASLVGVSPMHDMAVLKIAIPHKGRTVPIGTSGDLKVGQKVFAIGNPFGLDWTLTTGIVSALDRSLEEENGTIIEHLIQTDAAINPGNSGGPLLDSAGRLIGINTAIYSPSGASAGVGFAVPVDTVNRVVPQLIGQGKYSRPNLGIEVDQDVNKVVTSQLGIQGVLVLKTKQGSPAAKAGLRGSVVNKDGSLTPGDIIVAVQGKKVTSVQGLQARLDDFKAGDAVQLSIVRENTTQDITVVLNAL